MLLQGSCGFGLLQQNQYPFWRAGALSTSNHFFLNEPQQACGECFEVLLLSMQIDVIVHNYTRRVIDSGTQMPIMLCNAICIVIQCLPSRLMHCHCCQRTLVIRRCSALRMGLWAPSPVRSTLNVYPKK